MKDAIHHFFDNIANESKEMIPLNLIQMEQLRLEVLHHMYNESYYPIYARLKYNFMHDFIMKQMWLMRKEIDENNLDIYYPITEFESNHLSYYRNISQHFKKYGTCLIEYNDASTGSSTRIAAQFHYLKVYAQELDYPEEITQNIYLKYEIAILSSEEFIDYFVKLHKIV